MNKDNVILCDFNPGEEWNFQKGLEQSTKLKWNKIVNVNNDLKGSRFKRCFKYFRNAFSFFRNRKKYDNIIAWQQFYGLIFAFFSRLFHVKKRNNLYIMIFIYIPKKGLIGKIYYNFMRYILKSKYIDKIFVFSSAEGKRYSKEFGIDENLFVFMPFGDDTQYNEIALDIGNDIIFTSGYSNRDYNFLIETLKDMKYETRIYGKEKFEINNVYMSDEFVSPIVGSILNKTKIVVLPLKENRESGQFTLIHAMEYGIPVIATDIDCMKDYIINGYNGYILPNDANLWKEKIDELYNNNELYNEMSKNCKNVYKEKHTMTALGKNVGNIINQLMNKEN